MPLTSTISLKTSGLSPEDYLEIAPYTMPIKPLTLSQRIVVLPDAKLLSSLLVPMLL